MGADLIRARRWPAAVQGLVGEAGACGEYRYPGPALRWLGREIESVIPQLRGPARTRSLALLYKRAWRRQSLVVRYVRWQKRHTPNAWDVTVPAPRFNGLGEIVAVIAVDNAFSVPVDVTASLVGTHAMLNDRVK